MFVFRKKIVKSRFITLAFFFGICYNNLVGRVELSKERKKANGVLAKNGRCERVWRAYGAWGLFRANYADFGQKTVFFKVKTQRVQ